MKTYWRAAAAVVALTAAMTLGALLPATPGHSQVARQVVRVLQNGPNDAVPVTLQGGGANAGNVNVVNTPNVHVTNTPSVNVTNGTGQPLPVLDVIAPAAHAFEASAFIPAGNTQVPITIPAGKRLVIQTYDVELVVPKADPYPGLDLQTQLNGGTLVLHHLATQQSAVLAAFNVFEGTGQVALYSDGSPLAYLNAGNSVASATLQISGYLVPQP